MFLISDTREKTNCLICCYKILTTHPELSISCSLTHINTHIHYRARGIDLQSQEANPTDTEPPALPGLNPIQQAEV